MPDNNSNSNTNARCASDNAIYEDINFCIGSKSLPGTRNHGYYIKRSDIQTFPRPTGVVASGQMANVAVITDNIVPYADKVWKRFDLVPYENEAKSDNQGSYGSKTFNNQITLVLPGTGDKVTGFISELNNDDVVFLIPMSDGQCRLYGNPNFKVETTISQTSGKTATDPNTTTIEVSVTDEYATPFYRGQFTTSEGTFSGATDELVTAGE